MPLPHSRKILLTFLLTSAVLITGIMYQQQYHARKIVYTETIRGYYRTYLHREADLPGLNHWVNWALNRWGLEKVERMGFIEAAQKGAS